MELIIVLVIVGIMAVTAVVMWPGESINVSGQTDAVVQDIRYTQTLAMARALSGQRCRITFGTTSYTIADNTGAIVRSVSLGSGISIANNNFTGGYLAFDGRGAPYNGTTVMTAPITIDITSGGVTKRVSVWNTTGAVQVN